MGEQLTALQAELPALSSQGRHITVDGAYHEGLLSQRDAAGVVTASILRVVEAVRTGVPMAEQVPRGRGPLRRASASPGERDPGAPPRAQRPRTAASDGRSTAATWWPRDARVDAAQGPRARGPVQDPTDPYPRSARSRTAGRRSTPQPRRAGDATCEVLIRIGARIARPPERRRAVGRRERASPSAGAPGETGRRGSWDALHGEPGPVSVVEELASCEAGHTRSTRPDRWRRPRDPRRGSARPSTAGPMRDAADPRHSRRSQPLAITPGRRADRRPARLGRSARIDDVSRTRSGRRPVEPAELTSSRPSARSAAGRGRPSLVIADERPRCTSRWRGFGR